MARKIRFIVTLLITLIAVSACGKEGIDNLTISANEVSEVNIESVAEKPARDDGRRPANVDIKTVVDAYFDNRKNISDDYLSYKVNGQIDINRVIGYDSFKVGEKFDTVITFQNEQDDFKMSLTGKGVGLINEVIYETDIEAYFGAFEDRNAFYFKDPVATTDWYYIYSDMPETFIANSDSYESIYRNYLYSANVYENNFDGVDCYQIVINNDQDFYINFLHTLLEQGEIRKYWDMWHACYEMRKSRTFDTIFKVLRLETSIYVSKNDYSFVGARIYADDVDVLVKPIKQETDTFEIPLVMNSEARDYINDIKKRDGLVRVLSNKWKIYGYSPSYYYNEEKSEIRLMNSNYSEIRRFNVPEGFKAFDSSDGAGSSWYLIKDENFTGFEFAYLNRSNIEATNVYITETGYGKKDVIDSGYKLYVGDTEVEVVKEQRGEAEICSAYVTYFSTVTMEERYVRIEIRNYGDCSIISDEMKELITEIIQ